MNDTTAVGLNRVQMLESIHVAKILSRSGRRRTKPLRALTIEADASHDFSSDERRGWHTAGFRSIAVRSATSPITAALERLRLSPASASPELGKASNLLAKLGEQSRATGCTANTLTGGKIVGARAGLTEEQSIGAHENASRRVRSVWAHSGPVKDILEG
ncbi:MAG: hypothetical protein U1E25_14605 [Methylocystis sp.]